jgi:HNH endonuclease
MASEDRFYLLEFPDRPVVWGDVGSNLRINGLVVGGAGCSAILLLPGLKDDFVSRSVNPIHELTEAEWSEFIRRSDDPEILMGMPKVFQRKMRYAISGAVQQKIWAADNFQCVYCGAKMGDTMLTVDHVEPLELGGKNDSSNFVSACRSCNKKKGNQPPLQWMAHATIWLGTPEEKLESLKLYMSGRKV